MKDMPQWVNDLIRKEKLTCNKCKFVFSITDLMSIGVQKSLSKSGCENLITGFYCKYCKDMTIFEIKEMSLIEFAFDVIDDDVENEIRKKEHELDTELSEEVAYNSKHKPSRKTIDRRGDKGKNRSKITMREIKECAKFLKNCKTHDEFLMAIGYSPEEIDFYKIKIDNKNKHER